MAICYVNIEPLSVMRDKVLGKTRLARLEAGRLKFEALSGDSCIVKHYLSLRAEDLMKARVRAVLLSGNFADWSLYDVGEFGELFKLIDNHAIPTLGLCGGHQLLTLIYGGKVEPMRALKPGEIDPWPKFYPGFCKERGFKEVKVIESNPLFEGLPSRIVVNEAHYAEVKELPEVFKLIAIGDECPIQAISHKMKPIYGTQFHPENYDDVHPDGMIVLKNFFDVAWTRTSSQDLPRQGK